MPATENIRFPKPLEPLNSKNLGLDSLKRALGVEIPVSTTPLRNSSYIPVNRKFIFYSTSPKPLQPIALTISLPSTPPQQDPGKCPWMIIPLNLMLILFWKLSCKC